MLKCLALALPCLRCFLYASTESASHSRCCFAACCMPCCRRLSLSSLGDRARGLLLRRAAQTGAILHTPVLCAPYRVHPPTSCICTYWLSVCIVCRETTKQGNNGERGRKTPLCVLAIPYLCPHGSFFSWSALLAFAPALGISPDEAFWAAFFSLFFPLWIRRMEGLSCLAKRGEIQTLSDPFRPLRLFQAVQNSPRPSSGTCVPARFTAYHCFEAVALWPSLWSPCLDGGLTNLSTEPSLERGKAKVVSLMEVKRQKGGLEDRERGGGGLDKK